MRNKFRAKRTHFAGQWFDSGAESECYAFLKLLERAGEIKDIERQVTVYLTKARISYRVDFKIYDLKLFEDVWVEYKGFETPEWRIKRKLWMFYGPGRLRVYKGRGSHMEVTDEIVPAPESLDNQNPF